MQVTLIIIARNIVLENILKLSNAKQELEKS